MHHNEQRFPDLPHDVAIHTTNYKLTQTLNDPLLSEFLYLGYMKRFVKKSFWSGDYILLSDTIELKSLIALTGAYVAMTSNTDATNLMRLSTPRESTDFSLLTIKKNTSSTLLDREYSAYEIQYGNSPHNLFETHTAQSVRDLEDIAMRDVADRSKVMSQKMGVKRSVLPYMLSPSRFSFNIGIMTAFEHPELCHDVISRFGDDVAYLTLLCRGWASTWRPQLEYLFR